MKKKLLSILMATVVLAGVFTGCGNKEAKEEAKPAAEKFVLGFDQEFPPMGFVGEDGEFTGFDIELGKEVAERLGMEFVPQPIAWDAKDLELESGTISCIWNGFTMTGREDNYTFSKPYLENRQVFVVLKDSGIATQADLAGKVVEVQADSSAEAAMKENTALSDTFKKLQAVADYNTAMMDLEAGAVDAIAMDEVVAAFQIQAKEDTFVILDEEISAEEYAVGFLKGNDELKDKVDATLKEMADDGTMAEISEKWFGKDITIFK